MRRRFTSVFIAIAVIVAQTGYASTPVDHEIKGELYLNNCSDILAMNSSDYEKKLVAAAASNGQLLQLLYDGGLIFSNVFSMAFVVTLKQQNIQLPNPKSVADLKKFASTIAKLARMSDEDAINFMWRVFENEKVVLAGIEASDSQREVRFNQIKNLIDALKASDSASQVQEVLKNLTAQSFLSLARLTWLKGSSILANKGLSEDRYPMLKRIGLFGGAVGAVSGAILAYHGSDIALKHVLGYSYYDYDTLLKAAQVAFAGLVGWNSLRWGFNLSANAVLLVVSRPYLMRANELDKEARQIETYEYLMPKINSVERIETANILEDFANSDQVVSVDDACTKSICDLSPIQIAYLGDVDLLDLQGLLNRLRGSLGDKANLSLEDSLRESLKRVIADPNDYEAQMLLKLKIKQVRETVLVDNAVRIKAIDEITQKLVSLKESLSKLREKPYTENLNTPEAVARGKLLVNRLNSDLQRLDDIRVALDNFVKSTDRLRPITDVLSRWLAELPNSPEGWGPVSQSILSEFDALGAPR